jgi:hypothetical protein
MQRPPRAPSEGTVWGRLRGLDREFVAVARVFGFELLREAGAYVSYQGDSVIRVAPYEDLDPDDTLGQMVVHELCHYFVEGPQSREQWDWGLCNDGEEDEPAELAAIRVQAALLEDFGLRAALGPTTDFRFEYDLLASPLEDSDEQEVVARARMGLARLRAHDGFSALSEVLRRAQELSES